jgi:type VI secretion system FHA domain protein
MSITVKIMRRAPGGRATLYATRGVEVLPVSIGRDAACTIVLENPHKHISRFHVEIEEEDGIFWMSVVSKVNPVMVKGRRYGPGTRLTLNSGDAFDVAEYEVQLLLPEAASPEPARPAAQPATAQSGDPLMHVLSASATHPPTTPALGADDAERLFNEATFLGGDAPPPKKPIPAEPAPEATFIPVKAKPRPPAPRPALTGPAALLHAFFEGAGLPAKELSAAQSEQTLRECGAILRAAIDGVMMLLLARAEMRKEFQAEERTMVAARDNNPLKLMSDPHEAMDFLFDPAARTEGFLDPVQAVGDACEDLRSHEIALMAGMRAAILGAMRRFDPHVLERAYEKSEKGFSFASRKAQLWDLYVAQQDKLARESQEDFTKVFGRDFMSAYQAQLRRMKGGK